MKLSRRRFIGGSCEAAALAALSGALRPSCAFAQGAPGRFKNLVHIFLYGGASWRYVFPYFSGPIDTQLRQYRPNSSVNDIRALSGMDQQGRQNPVGFHSRWQNLLSFIEANNLGFQVITEYGVTANNNFSHDVAQKQHLNVSPRSPSAVTQGLFGRVIDAYNMQAFTVWGLNVDEPAFFNAATERPLVLSGLSTFSFSNRNFGSFDCSGVPNTACARSNDRFSSAQDDSALARSAQRALNQITREAMPFGDAIKTTVEGVYDSVPIVQDMAGVTVDPALFRAPNEGNTTFSNGMTDVARIINYSNSPSAPQSLRESTKLIATGLDGWDSHAKIDEQHTLLIARLSAALHGLLQQLKDWGLINDTLIILTSEFDRTLRENSALGHDHACGGYFGIIGPMAAVPRRIVGPEARMQELINQNHFSAQVPATGVYRQILSLCGFSSTRFPLVFPDSMPGEEATPNLFL